MDGPLPAGSAAGAGGAPSAGDLEPGSPQRPVGAPYPVLLLDLKGRVLAPPNQHAPWDKAAGARAARGEIVFTNAALDGRPLRVLSRPFPQTGPPVGVVQGAYPLTEVNRALAGVSRSLLALAPIALLFAALGAALLTGRVLRPVGDMAGAAGRIGAQDLSQRLPAAGKDEFGELAGTFNHMLDRLERGFQEKELLVEQLRHAVEQQRRFTADASHELRTPLAVIKANASLCLQGRPKEEEYRQSVQDINRAADSMTRLVLDLLLLARSDSGQLGRNPITIAVRDLLERAAAHASHREGAPVQVHVVDEPLYVLGNEEELVRVFSNLLENARRYTPAEGKITLAARRSGNAVQVIVADTGVGIAPEHLPHLGERFYRVDASRSRPDGGSGLGLSICKSIVDAHQGRMVFHSTVGTGTTVHVVLPAADNQGWGGGRKAAPHPPP